MFEQQDKNKQYNTQIPQHTKAVQYNTDHKNKRHNIQNKSPTYEHTNLKHVEYA